eukprot:5025744-Alexandrium_andersonii.AAC.2
MQGSSKRKEGENGSMRFCTNAMFSPAIPGGNVSGSGLRGCEAECRGTSRRAIGRMLWRTK